MAFKHDNNFETERVLKSHKICVPMPLVPIAPNKQDTSLTLTVLGEFK